VKSKQAGLHYCDFNRQDIRLLLLQPLSAIKYNWSHWIQNLMCTGTGT